jgi:hypothetical protein
MTLHQPFEIHFNKNKLILALLGSIALVGIVFWGLMNLPEGNFSIFSGRTIIFIAGFSTIVFFTFAFVWFFCQLLNKTPGLIINDSGIIDNTNSLSVGFIPWSDLLEIRKGKKSNQKFLMLIIRNLEDLINKTPNLIKRQALKINLKMSGTAILIQSMLLKINFDDLCQLLVDIMTEYESQKR